MVILSLQCNCVITLKRDLVVFLQATNKLKVQAVSFSSSFDKFGKVTVAAAKIK